MSKKPCLSVIIIVLVCIGLLAGAYVLIRLNDCSNKVNSHGIPNGMYRNGKSHKDDGSVQYIGGSDYGWTIKCNEATYYISSFPYHICRIVEEEGKIYFDFTGEESSKSFKYEVEYNAEDKKLIVHGENEINYFSWYEYED